MSISSLYLSPFSARTSLTWRNAAIHHRRERGREASGRPPRPPFWDNERRLLCFTYHINHARCGGGVGRLPTRSPPPSLPQTVIYHGVFIEHAPASHLIIIMERRVELLSPLINVRPADRTYVCVTAVAIAGRVDATAGDASPSPSASRRRID